MLILGRKLDQAIIVGTGPDAIRIVVTSIGRCQVKIGVDAPNGVRIDREEVFLRKLKENGSKGVA